MTQGLVFQILKFAFAYGPSDKYFSAEKMFLTCQ